MTLIQPAKLTFTVQELAPGPNGRGGLLRMQWRARRTILKRWTIEIRAQRPAIWSPATRARVRITRHSTGTMDQDNLSAACKIPLDALRHAGVIVDDGPNFIDLKTEQVASPVAKTVIEVEAIRDAVSYYQLIRFDADQRPRLFEVSLLSGLVKSVRECERGGNDSHACEWRCSIVRDAIQYGTNPQAEHEFSVPPAVLESWEVVQ